MRTVLASLAAGVILSVTGCAWPAATWVHGPVTIERPPGQAQSRVVLIKCWEAECIGAQVTTEPEANASFPLHFYLALFTPALGIQGIVPNAEIIAFSEGCWPASAIQNGVPRTDAAPSTGLCRWHIVLEKTDKAPAPYPFPASSTESQLTMDELNRVLSKSRMTEADREMCRRQLQHLLDYQRANSPTPKR